jgi:hypothetical protein
MSLEKMQNFRPGIGCKFHRAMVEGDTHSTQNVEPVEPPKNVESLVHFFGLFHGFHVLCRMGVNEPGGCRRCSGEEMEELMALVDVTKLSSKDLKDIVKPSGLVSADHLIEIYEVILLGFLRSETCRARLNMFGADPSLVTPANIDFCVPRDHVSQGGQLMLFQNILGLVAPYSTSEVGQIGNHIYRYMYA